MQSNSAQVVTETERDDELTAIEYLRQARRLDAAISVKRKELKKLEETATALSSPAFGDKVKTSGVNDAMKTVDKIIMLDAEIKEEISRLIDLKTEIHDRINRVAVQDYITLLTSRYILCNPFPKIAEDMNVDERTLYRWHGIALELFRKENHML